MRNIENIIGQIQEQIKEKEKNGNGQDKTRTRKDRKIPEGFECYVCGTNFVTNEERKHHLKKGTHGHLYNTISPQEREEVRSAEDN